MTDDPQADRRWREFVRDAHDQPAPKPARPSADRRELANDAIRGAIRGQREATSRFARRQPKEKE